MEQSQPRTMAAVSWLLLICLAAGVPQAHAQPDSIGFISIDCGLPGTASYVDDTTKLVYVPDAGFTDAGSNYNISPGYMTSQLSKRYYNVRSFPDGVRNCYTLRSLVMGLKYLIRATFKYGNYDGLNRLPVFDVYIGVNFWSMVNISRPEGELILEAIVVVPDDYVQVCLVNTGSGTPFISGLVLRPLFKGTLYPQVNATRGLVLQGRRNFGPTDATALVRYPDDPYDRIWDPMLVNTSYTTMSTTERVANNNNGDRFDVPSAVMQTAVTPRNASSNLEVFWHPKPQPKDPTPGYFFVLHFSELQLLPGGAVREFYINHNGMQYSQGYRPPYLISNARLNINPTRGYDKYNISLNATANSTLPPIINAMEVFTVMPTTTIGTDSSDVSAITAIRAKYRVQKNWMGDPCMPNNFSWDGLTCIYTNSSHPRIVGLNLSFSGLSGDISSSFADLMAIQSVNLSHNNLAGSIPDAFSHLPSLVVLDLSDNQLSGSIPPGLLKRIQDGSLNLRYGGNPNLCANKSSCQIQNMKGKSKLAIYIVISVVLVFVIISVVVLLICLMRRKKKGSMTNNSVNPQNEAMSQVPPGDTYTHSSLELENRRFTYAELEAITNDFQRVLGRGGFGYVYYGILEDGTQVAVKLRSESSNQGVKEFLAEAQILARIHHKNLVSMVGYCKNEQCMALVYEYMSEGTLQEHIEGNGRNGRHLTWRHRLRIAYESAQGLEYLHRGCNPPLIHRDVKATNILLNENLEAKIADFGLSKAFNRYSEFVSTNMLVGTPGYVDPEYQATMQLTTKSDVYSFGVVLLELITGKPPIVRDMMPTTIIQWVRQRLAQGNIEGILDATMHDNYDVNGVWKVADIALKCTAQTSAQRPTMTDVVLQLQECLTLEDNRIGRDINDGLCIGSNGGPNQGYNVDTSGDHSMDMSQSNTAFDLEHDYRRVPTAVSGPFAR